MVQNDKNSQHNQSEEITFRDLLIRIRDYYRDLRRNWKLILIVGLVFMFFWGIRAYNSKTEYVAKLSFMINEDSGNPLGSLSSVLGSFGFNSRGKNNLPRVIELARSRNIILNSMLRTVNIEDADDLLINHYINYFDTLDMWNTKPWYKRGSIDSLPAKITFPGKDSIVFDHDEKLAINKIFKKIVGNTENNNPGMMESGYNEDSRILHLSFTSENPYLSEISVNTVFDVLSDFYIQKSIEKQKTTFDILQIKTDSLAKVLSLRENQLAEFEDSWLGRYSSKSKLKQKQLEREVRILNIALAESVKNLEIADFAVRNTMPYVQVIDRPAMPLDVRNVSMIRNLILGFIVGVFMAALYIFFKNLFLRAMST